MSTKYTVRVASPVQYEYWEAEADTFEELLSAEQELRELKAQAGGEVPPAQGVANVKKAFGNTTEQPSSGGGFGKKASGFGGNQGRQESTPDKIELGKHEGYTITLYTKGKFGPYVNAYNYDSKDKLPNKNLPKGADAASFTLDQAIELWAE